MDTFLWGVPVTLPAQGVTGPVPTAGAGRSVFIVVEHFMRILSSLPTAKLLVAGLISFLIKEEQTSHFPWAGFR